MKKHEQLTTDRTSDAYDEGKRAYAQGLSKDDCPSVKGQARLDWFAGWLDAWSDEKHGPIFRKYGVDEYAAKRNRQRRQHGRGDQPQRQ